MTGQDEEGAKAVGRLRRWSIAQKCRIVEETFVVGASVAAVARRHNVNANQVFGWRKKYRQGRLLDKKAATQVASGHDLVRIGVIDHDCGIRPLPAFPPSPDGGKALPEARPGGIMEIELVSGVKLRVDVGIEESALRRALALAMEVS